MSKEIRTERRDDLFKDYVIARVERAGEKFEVLVKPDAVAKIRDGKDASILENLAIDEIFRDAHKGSKASEENHVRVDARWPRITSAIRIRRKAPAIGQSLSSQDPDSQKGAA